MANNMTELTKANIRNALFRKFDIHLNVIEQVKKLFDNMETYKKAKNILKEDLGDIVTKSKSQHPDDLYADDRFDARVKDELSLKVKLFNKMWYKCGYDKKDKWPETANNSFIDPLLNKDNLNKAFDDIKDIVGGRIVVCCTECIEDGTKRVKKELTDRGYYIYKKMDKDYIRAPQKTYYGYHIFIKVPIGKKRLGKRTGKKVLAELQVQTLLGNAWAVFGHDTYYKNVLLPGNQYVSDNIKNDVVLINSGLIVNDGLFGALRNRLMGLQRRNDVE